MIPWAPSNINKTNDGPKKALTTKLQKADSDEELDYHDVFVNNSKGKEQRSYSGGVGDATLESLLVTSGDGNDQRSVTRDPC